MNSTKKLSTLLVGALFLTGMMALPADAQQGRRRTAPPLGPGDGTAPPAPRTHRPAAGQTAGTARRRRPGERFRQRGQRPEGRHRLRQVEREGLGERHLHRYRPPGERRLVEPRLRRPARRARLTTRL